MTAGGSFGLLLTGHVTFSLFLLGFFGSLRLRKWNVFLRCGIVLLLLICFGSLPLLWFCVRD